MPARLDPPVILPTYFGEKAEFHETEGLLLLVQREQQFLEALKKAAEPIHQGRPHDLLNSIPQQLNVFAEVRREMEQLLKDADGAQLRHRRDRINDLLQGLPQYGWVSANHPVSIRAAELMSIDPVLAVSLFHAERAAGFAIRNRTEHHVGKDQILNGALHNGMDGWIERFAVNYGIDARSEAWRESLKTMLQDLQREANALKEHAQASRGHWDTAKSEIESERRNQTAKLGEMQDLCNAQLGAFFLEKRKEIAELESLYREKIYTEAPRHYWKRKADKHRNVAIVFSGLFALYIIASFVAPWFWVEHFKAYFDWLKNTNTIGIALIAVPIFLLLWPLRLIYRVLNTNIALTTDASERVAMVDTFLALMKDERAVGEQDRALVLGALFRPSNQTSSGDDSGPAQQVLDVLTNRAR